jgi:RNA polymerase sigma-70 factor (ECF subfamily)
MSRSENPPSEDAASHSAASESLIDRTFLQQLQAGDDAAMQKLFERYSQRLVQLAGKNIHPALVKRFDGEDVVQSVFRTFFRRQDAGQLKIEHSQQLWRLLATITLCKTRSHARRHTAEKRNAQAEQPQASHFEFLDHEPAPDDALALWEEIDVVLEGLPERTGEILTARLEGKHKSEIARELNLSRQTIHRILNLLEQRLDERFQRFSPENPGN